MGRVACYSYQASRQDLNNDPVLSITSTKCFREIKEVFRVLASHS